MAPFSDGRSRARVRSRVRVSTSIAIHYRLTGPSPSSPCPWCVPTGLGFGSYGQGATLRSAPQAAIVEMRETAQTRTLHLRKMLWLLTLGKESSAAGKFVVTALVL